MGAALPLATKWLIGLTAASTAASAASASASRSSARKTSNSNMAQQRDIENQRRRNELMQQRDSRDAETVRNRVAANEASRLQGLSLSQKGVKPKPNLGSLSAVTENVLRERQ